MVPRLLTLLFLASVGAAAQNTTRCYQCTNVRNPAECTTVTECPEGQQCMVEEFVTSSGTLLYNSRCQSQQKCGISRRSVISDTLTRRAGSNIMICVHCCDGDFCNDHGCRATAPTTQSTGPTCFNCETDGDPGNCSRVARCDAGQICMLSEISQKRSDGTMLYRSACTSQTMCHAYALVGKRKKRATYCHVCCHDNFCNNRCEKLPLTPTKPPTTTTIRVPTKTTQTTTASTPTITTTKTATTPTTSPTTKTATTPTTSPTTKTTTTPTTSSTTTTIRPMLTTASPQVKCQRYHGYHYVSSHHIHICYKFHYERKPWYDAGSVCRKEGGHLAIVDTRDKWDLLKNRMGKDHNLSGRVYLGAIHHYPNSNGFHWINGARLTYAPWSSGEPDMGNQNMCVYTASEYQWHWHDTSCENSYQFACTIDV